jgi:uncharacterized membrane protein YjdF
MRQVISVWFCPTSISFSKVGEHFNIEYPILNVASKLMQASIRNRLIAKPFELFFEMQHAALEITDHRIIG